MAAVTWDCFYAKLWLGCFHSWLFITQIFSVGDGDGQNNDTDEDSRDGTKPEEFAMI